MSRLGYSVFFRLHLAASILIVLFSGGNVAASPPAHDYEGLWSASMFRGERGVLDLIFTITGPDSFGQYHGEVAHIRQEDASTAF